MSKDRPGIYLLASISKPMTAAGVLLLSDRGELALDDKVRKFIPEFKEGDRADITIRHLLTHTSGFLDRLNENLEMRKRSAPLLEFVEKAIRTPLLFKLGERYKYQSIGTLLVAEVCQRITKTSFPDYLDSGLFGPLGMKHSVMGLGNIRIKDTERSQVEKGPPHSGLGKPDAAHWDWNGHYWRNFASHWGGAHATAEVRTGHMVNRTVWGHGEHISWGKNVFIENVFYALSGVTGPDNRRRQPRESPRVSGRGDLGLFGKPTERRCFDSS